MPGLLVEYSLKDGCDAEQREALTALVAGLKAEGSEGFAYTGYATNDPTRFVGVFEFTDEAGKSRFLESAAFKTYRDGAAERFTAPPSAAPIDRIASTKD